MKNVTFLFCILLFGNSLTRAQDTTYYNEKWEVLTSGENRTYTIVSEVLGSDLREITFFDTLKVADRTFLNDGQKKLNGTAKDWYLNGQLSGECNYLNGRKHGSCVKYWESGIIKKEEWYDHDFPVSSMFYNEEGVLTDSFVANTHPEYAEGEDALYKYIFDSIIYPEKAKAKYIEGTVIVSFIVNKDGSISDLSLKEGVHKELDEEALRVMSGMGKWKPATDNGIPVKAMVSVPIEFYLKGK